jgi:thiamine pyrophosphate-dependent acetolactate synthase large subunit-like protein
VGFPDFAKLADAFGVGYYVLHDEQECDSVLKGRLKVMVRASLKQ